MLEAIKVEIEKCPVCGGERRLGQELFENNKPFGAPEGQKQALEMQVIPIAAHNSLVTGKVLIVMRDYCMDCGAGYMVRAFEQSGHIEIKPGQTKLNPG